VNVFGQRGLTEQPALSPYHGSSTGDSSSILDSLRGSDMNKLIDETSPYLLQHAHNPVDWHPWNEQALAKARSEDKPILLSVGYSACHWCHVMEHESFEDEEVAKVMNELFVCIKVDREERPDLDKIYQIAHQMLSQRPGGWPLNVFLTPKEHAPIFAGTYFPKDPRHGLPGFVEVLRRVSDHYRQHKQGLAQHHSAIVESFRRIEPIPPDRDVVINPHVLQQARDELAKQYDRVYGGFGSAPKFPHPTNIERCLRHWAHSVASGTPDGHALKMAQHTLQAMSAGGLYDQLGGGFCRYSVDDYWQIPHFEKMLYDNAQLLPLYVDVATATSDDACLQVAIETAEWVMRDMQSEDGGYYSTLDADSEGEEGKFYVWTTKELKQLLSEDEWPVVEVRYGLRGRPNFEGKWHLNVKEDMATVAARADISEEHANELLATARRKLLEVRDKRAWPTRDEKILTSWNAMMIKAMAHAGRFLDRDDFTDSAKRALKFVRTTLWQGGRLYATTRDGKTHLNAYLDDHVLLIDAILEMVQARWHDGAIKYATELADVLLTHFEDSDAGAFYFTSDDHEKLLHRHKPTSDDAVPSGNGIAAIALLRLGHLLGDQRYLAAAERTLKALYAGIERYPSAHGSLLVAVEEYLHPTETIILRGNPEDTKKWAARCLAQYAPRRMIISIPMDAGNLPGILVERKALDHVAAYVCEGFQCKAPITGLAELSELLTATQAPVV